MFKIKYGGLNPFEGLAPTPFVSREVSTVFYADKYADVNNITLNGILTGCDPLNNEFSGTYANSKALADSFSKSFQHFQIYEDLGSGVEGIVFTEGHALVNSVTFEESTFAGYVPFTINLRVFEESSFESGLFGVLDPVQNESFSDNADGSVTFNRQTSARGFHTNKLAIDNARIFVQSITGGAPSYTPLFVSQSGYDSGVLLSTSESINRLNGSYSVNEEWVYNKEGNIGQASIYNYATEISSGQQGVSVSINGNVIGGRKTSLDDLRSDFSNIDLLSLAEAIYSGAGFSGGLSPEPTSRSINEGSKAIDFSYTYSNIIKSDPYVIDTLRVTCSYDDPKRCYNASVNIRSNDICPTGRWAKVNNYYNNFDITGWIDEKLTDYGYDLNLADAPSSMSTSFDETNGSIQLQFAACESLVGFPSGFTDFDYSVSIDPAKPNFVPFQGLDGSGHHIVQRLNGVSRKIVSIRGQGVKENCFTEDDAKQSLINFMEAEKNKYVSGNDAYVINDNIQFGGTDNPNSMSFNFGWNEQSDLEFDLGLFYG